MLEADIALDGRPVFLFGMQAVAILGDNLRRIGDFLLGVQQRDHALCRSLRVLQLGELLCQLLDRVEQLRGIGQEGG